MNIVVGIATSGRPFILRSIVKLLSEQTRSPDRIIVCPSDSSDLPDMGFENVSVDFVSSARGSSHQRNAILKASLSADIVVFFDDDFCPHQDYLKECEALFTKYTDIVVATGHVFQDGINGPGIPFEEALDELLQVKKNPERIEATYGAYGCNMAIRMQPVRQYGYCFDENLPLYGWQEDIDLSRQIARHGRVVQYFPMMGIHLGHKGGRTSGVRTGYSQIANPWYLMRKGTLSARFACDLAARNLLANLIRSWSPEPWVDRRGRLRGNFAALLDIVVGRCHPRRILEM